MLLVCTQCKKAWEMIVKEDDSGSGMWAFIRNPRGTRQITPPCDHFIPYDTTFTVDIDQFVRYIEVEHMLWSNLYRRKTHEEIPHRG